MIIAPLGMALMAMSILVISNYHSRGVQMNGLAEVVDLFDAFGKLVNGLQVERGKTAQYFLQKLSLKELQDHRHLNVDKELLEARKKLTIIPFSSADINSAQTNFDTIANLRKKIDSREIKFPEAFEEYSAIIHKMIVLAGISTSLFISPESGPKIEQRLANLITVEALKESMGQTRATYEEVFVKNAPLDLQKFKKLESIRAGISTLADSPILAQAPIIHEKILTLMTSAKWKSVTEELDIVTSKASTGGYGVDSKVFFDKISDIINSVGDILKSERVAVFELAHNEAADAYRIFSFISAAIFVLFSGLIIFSWMIINTLLEETREKRRTEELLLEAKQAAESSNRAKSIFLANMSHEIRTPMNAIIGMGDLLSKTKLDHEQATYIDILKKAGFDLLHIVDNILDMSKIESDKFKIQKTEFNLKTIVRDTIETLNSKAKTKKLILTYFFYPNTPECIYGDNFRIKQILMNLIDNSIKFTTQGSITLRVSRNTDKSKKGNLWFEVTDTGIGISKTQQDKLFVPYSQVDSTATKPYGGTGLGLAISKKLIEMMGGEIWIESQEGSGTTVYLTLECEELKVISTKTESQQTVIKKIDNQMTDLKKTRILLVDDSEVNRLLIKEYLKDTNHIITEAENGRIAVEKAKLEEYNIILMDMQMPIMDGYSATQEIRKWEKQTNHAHIPIVAVTAYSMKDELERALAAGCDQYLAKPILKENLIGTLGNIIGHESDAQ